MSEYQFVAAVSEDVLTEKVNSVAAQGYEVVTMTQSEDENAVHYLVCMKRAVPHD